MHIKFSGFDWDPGNSAKCQEHGVPRSEIEALFASGSLLVGPDAKHSLYEDRFFAIGRSHRRAPYVFVVFTIRLVNGEMLIGPISARHMHKKEIQRYEETLAEIEK